MEIRPPRKRCDALGKAQSLLLLVAFSLLLARLKLAQVVRVFDTE